MKVPELRFFAYMTFAMSAFFTLMWILSASIDGEWTFGANSLSDMGISKNPVSAFLFNFGCIGTGTGGVIIGIGMYLYGNKTVWVSGLVYIVSMIFLALVGVFTLPQHMHFVVATSFGVFFGISAIISSISDWKRSWYPFFDIGFLIASAIIMTTQAFEIWEPLMVILSMVWTMYIGYKMLTDGELFGDGPIFRRF